jgi:hypothetical protein
MFLSRFYLKLQQLIENLEWVKTQKLFIDINTISHIEHPKEVEAIYTIAKKLSITDEQAQ